MMTKNLRPWSANVTIEAEEVAPEDEERNEVARGMTSDQDHKLIGPLLQCDDVICDVIGEHSYYSLTYAGTGQALRPTV